VVIFAVWFLEPMQRRVSEVFGESSILYVRHNKLTSQHKIERGSLRTLFILANS